MVCLFCKHGETRSGSATVMLQRGDRIVIFKGVPADVCETCGEEYFAEAVTSKLLAQAEEAVRSGAEVEIRKYAA